MSHQGHPTAPVVGPTVNEDYLASVRPPGPQQAQQHGNDMTRALGDAAGGSSFTHRGATYYVSAPSVGRCTQFCEWCKRNAREELAEFAPLVPKDVYAASIAAFAASARGKYVWRSETVDAELRTQDGMVEWVRILLFERHPHLTRDDIIDIIAESGAKLELALSVFTQTQAGATT